MYKDKKLQSAIEFLSTYGFMITIVALLIILIVYIAAPLQSTFPSQCTAYGGIVCVEAAYYSNSVSGQGYVLIKVSNSGSAPVNIIDANVVINGKQAYVPCSPNFVNPASNSLCYGPAGSSLTLGQQVTGQFLVKADVCNSNTGAFNQISCNYLPTAYSGSFLTYASPPSQTST